MRSQEANLNLKATLQTIAASASVATSYSDPWFAG